MCFSIGSDIFGPYADSLLAYQTLKVVRLKDHRLGLIYYGLMLTIIVFVLGYEVLYSNDHFDKRDVSGTVRLAIRQPTVKACDPKERDCRSDFSSLMDLPYCSVYKGPTGVVTPEKQRGCIFADRDSLLPQGVPTGSMLVPTQIQTVKELRSCDPGPANNYTCSNEFDINEEEEQYIADIERYSILISHSYHRDTMSGNNNRVLGYYLDCDTSALRKTEMKLQETVFGASECRGVVRRLPIECVNDACHFLPPSEMGRADAGRAASVLQDRQVPRRRRGPRHAADLSLASADAEAAGEALAGGQGLRHVPRARAGYLDDGVFAIPEGDVFTVGKLLRLAGIASLDNATTLDGESLRRAGTVVNIEVKYSNLIPFRSTFGQGEVAYEYHISLKPMHEVQDNVVRWAPLDSTTRVVERRHGILFVVSVSGYFGFFSIVNTLLMLAEAASMLAVATLLTDKIAIYLMAKSQIYYGSKYEEPSILIDDA